MTFKMVKVGNLSDDQKGMKNFWLEIVRGQTIQGDFGGAFEILEINISSFPWKLLFCFAYLGNQVNDTQYTDDWWDWYETVINIWKVNFIK